MDMLVKPVKELSGTVSVPPSKSYTHRYILASTLANGKSTIKNPLYSDDTLATLRACESLGASIEQHDGNLIVYGPERLQAPSIPINCYQSGTTLRLLTPILSVVNGIAQITAEERLKTERPIGELLDSLKELGVEYDSTHNRPPLIVKGRTLKGGRCHLPGNISSQFVSGLLFATPLAERDTEILLTTNLQSKPYVNMTLEVLQNYGIEVRVSDDFYIFNVLANQKYEPHSSYINGDWSSAANILIAASILPSKVRVMNLYKDRQGDRKVLDILRETGADITVGEDYVEVNGGKKLTAFCVDCRDNPDLMMPLVALALNSEGSSTIYGVDRLIGKESNRLEAVLTEFGKMGGELELLDNSTLRVKKSKLRGTETSSHRDHRIAMALYITGLNADGETYIHDFDSIKKSYPEFQQDMESLIYK